MNKKILRLALPNIITNITVPLLGIVDLAIVGHIGNEQYIGAIGIGTTIFNMIYWNFGFLRMGTSGFTAQAYGANDMKESVKILVRASVIALSIAALLLLLQYPIALLSKNFVRGSEEMIDYTLEYFYVRILSLEIPVASTSSLRPFGLQHFSSNCSAVSIPAFVSFSA